MALTEETKRKYSADEITVLEALITYADRMIYEDQNLDPSGGFAYGNGGFASNASATLYKQLRRNAYSKTVVIDTQKKGRLEFRLSSTEAVYPNHASGYCTPHSPIGRLAIICHPGFERSSTQWGDYFVTEVRSFDRYGGPEFERNVRNFLRMEVVSEEGKESVSDLRAFLAKKRSKKPTETVDEPQAQTIKPVEESPPPLPIEPPPAAVTIAEFAVVDDSDEIDAELDIDGEEEWDIDGPPAKQEEYFGLSERFFTHQTIEQNQVIARSPVGPMFVEGIAGSGKTSAALGRTKMLTTFNTASVTDEAQFREVVGIEQDYWAADFAGQFSQDSCVGFVRTGELIQYLHETCRRIDLPNLPVQEYKELQTRLRELRRVTSSPVKGRRWAGLTVPREAHAATTMAWLHAADQAIGRQIAEGLVSTLPKAEELAESFETKESTKVTRVVSIALEQLQQALQETVSDLTRDPRSGVFVLDKLATRLLSKIEEVRKRVMGPGVIWIRLENRTLFANDENALARKLVEAKAALYFRGGQRLVFVDTNGPIDASLQLTTTTGEPLPWSEETLASMAAGNVIVREQSGKNVRAVASDVNQLFLNLLPEATERIYVAADEGLRRLQLMFGWGRAKLRLLPTADVKVDEELADDETEPPAEATVPGQPRNSTPDAVFRRIVRRKLLQPLAGLADQYLIALQQSPGQFPDAQLAKRLHTQLNTFRLADEDVDLLLCLSHLVGRGLKQGGLRQLHEPTFYQAVFIDEVQDFTEQQVFLMVEQANPRYRAVTVVGDIAQKLHHGSSIDLSACFPAQALPHIKLTENLRQADSPGLALFSASFREVLQGGSPPSPKLAEQARTEGADLVRPKISVCETEEAMDSRIVDALTSAKRHQTVAVLFPDSDTATKTYARLEGQLRERMVEAELSEKVNLARRHVRHFADVANSKGLEFDMVLLAGVDKYDLSNTSHVNRLYVGITRARQSLILLSGTKSLSPQLTNVRTRYQAFVGQP